MSDNCEDISYLKQRVKDLENEILFLRKEKYLKCADKSTQVEKKTLVDEFNEVKDSKNDKWSICDMLRETSDECMNNSGYVFDPRTQLYFHKETGYYYDSATQLFFNPSNGCYYSYDSETSEYKFHSQEDLEQLKQFQKELVWIKGLQHKNPMEDQDNDDAACIRFINLKSTELSIITCCGGTLSTDCAINPTILMNKDEVGGNCTIDVKYDESVKKYRISLKADDNISCLINDSVLNEVWKELYHCDQLHFGSASYYIHIHDDHGTCDFCEPGLLSNSVNINEPLQSTIVSEVNQRSSKRIVKMLKAKYGLHAKVEKSVSEKSKYVDRAALRRKKEKEDASKIKVDKVKSGESKKADVAANMMRKMGWKPGSALGKDSSGLIEPIEAFQRLNARAGLGSDQDVSLSVETDPRTRRKLEMIDKTRLRYQKAASTAVQQHEFCQE